MRSAALAVLGSGLLWGCSAADPPTGCVPLAAGAMQWLPGGRFTMGEAARYPEEGPPRKVAVAGFWMDVHELTNAEFAAFVKATGYRTVAERSPPVQPDTPAEMRVPGSAVFTVPTPEDGRWWRWAVGAQWRHPSGEGESIAGKDTTPVVQIAFEDAEAYARWSGKSLPTEAQWEYAAQGAVAMAGDGTPAANTYQGAFPAEDLGLDHYRGRAPAGCFPPNRFGLYDMIGNVWEWTREAGLQADTRVIKGGSYLCAANYCARYRPAARQFQERGLGTDHIGVRFVDNRRAPPLTATR